MPSKVILAKIAGRIWASWLSVRTDVSNPLGKDNIFSFNKSNISSLWIRISSQFAKKPLHNKQSVGISKYSEIDTIFDKGRLQ